MVEEQCLFIFVNVLLGDAVNEGVPQSIQLLLPMRPNGDGRGIEDRADEVIVILKGFYGEPGYRALKLQNRFRHLLQPFIVSPTDRQLHEMDQGICERRGVTPCDYRQCSRLQQHEGRFQYSGFWRFGVDHVHRGDLFSLVTGFAAVFVFR